MYRGARRIIRGVADTVGAGVASREILKFGSKVFSMPHTPRKRRASLNQLARKKARLSLGYQAGRSIYRTPLTEKKAFDLPAFNLDFLNAGALNILALNVMVNGAELYQRVGRKVYMKSVHIRAYVENIGVAVTPDFLRIFVVYDSQSNGGLPGLATLLQDSNAAAASTPQSEINLVNRERFKIIKDYQILTPPVAVVANGPTAINDPIHNSWNINWFIKLKGLETIYNATNGGTFADISSGSLLLIACSVNTGNKWTLSGTSRLRYYD